MPVSPALLLVAAAAAVGVAATTSVVPAASTPVPAAGPSADAAARPVATPAVWVWPARPRPQVVRRYIAPLSAWGRGHRGLDLAVAAGSEVTAVDAGVVVHAGVVAGRGTVSVQHASGLRSTYEPVTPGVAVGDTVGRGDPLAVLTPSGAGHCGSRSCLHLGARRGDGYVDPLPLLVGGRVVLLPVPRR